MKKFKFNWGWGIFLTMTLFVLAMVYTVYLTMQNDYILESDNYYQETLEYDQVIVAERYGKTLFEGQVWKTDSTGNMTFILPLKIDSAQCKLLHPVDTKYDRELPVKWESNELTLLFSELPIQNQLWRVELSAFIGENEALLRKKWKH